MDRVVKVYLAAPMLGDRSNLAHTRAVLEFLESRGYSVTTRDWIAEEVLDVERGARPAEIFERDIRALEGSDVLVADVSYPSLGVGFEIAYALIKGKPVIAYCRRDRLEKTSALIRGISWEGFELLVYSELRDLLTALEEELKRATRRLGI